jgi:SAM-dependent methyltransferase
VQGAAFRAYKSRFVSAARSALADAGGGSPAMSEAAFPAYAHPSGPISFLFWKRVRVVMDHLEQRRGEAALDFGCGGGVMLPFLAERFRRVVGMDIELAPLAALERALPLPRNVEVVDARAVAPRDIPSRSFDVILALDVLEHVPDLDGTIDALARAVKPGSELIVSGPTENFAYKIGRKVAGRQFTGDYHVRGIAEIRRSLGRVGGVRTLATLFHPVPLFKVYAVTPR